MSSLLLLLVYRLGAIFHFLRVEVFALLFLKGATLAQVQDLCGRGREELLWLSLLDYVPWVCAVFRWYVRVWRSTSQKSIQTDLSCFSTTTFVHGKKSFSEQNVLELSEHGRSVCVVRLCTRFHLCVERV